MMKVKNYIPIALAGAIGASTTLGAVYLFNSPFREVVRLTEASDTGHNAVRTSGGLNATTPLDFSSVAEKVTPAVVHIRTKTLATRASNQQIIPNNPFGDMFGDDFKFFFGPQQGRPQQPVPQESTGSGVIFSADGYIVTNNHVIDNAEDIEVTLNDNRNYKAKLIGADPSTDIAVLQIKDQNLPFLKFGNSDNVKVGNWVLAIGNPYSFNSTVTAGVVSAKERGLNLLRKPGKEKEIIPIESFIQTDAAINPGNSGGALVSLNGDLVGINTAIASPTGSFAGYGFAVPSNLVNKVVEDILKYGVVQRGFLGIQIRDMNTDLAKDKDVEFADGVYVDSVNKESAAEEAGIKSKDIITKLDGHPVRNSSALTQYVGRQRPGDKINLTVNRNGKELVLPVVLKNKEGKRSVVKAEEKDSFVMLGVELEELSAKDKKTADVAQGVKVNKINPGKISQATDMRQGFIITHIDKQPVKDVADFKAKIKAKKGGILIEGVYPDFPGTYYYALGL